MAKEYIEREAAISKIQSIQGPILSREVRALRELPAADVVEVVHAEWIDIRFDPMWRSMLATCSHCKVRGEVRVKRNECGFAVPDSNHCPNCGERMDGE